jgi:hypothetical protein
MGIWILLPILGIGAYLILTQGPAAPVPGSGGQRYQSYMTQIQVAIMGYSTAQAFGSTDLPTIATTTKQTLTVIGQMAQGDQTAGNITTTDLSNINAAISAAQKQIS